MKTAPPMNTFDFFQVLKLTASNFAAPERENTQRLMMLNVVSNVADYICKISRNLDRCVFSAL